MVPIDVILVSLEDGQLYHSSKSVLRPLNFQKSNISEIVERWNVSTKLDFEGIPVTVATIQYPPFSMIKDVSKPEDFDGIEVLLLQELSVLLNLSLQYKVYEYWGNVLPNGSWRGGIGQAMQDGQVDLAIANLWQILSFYAIFDFGPALTNNRVAFLVRRPQQLDLERTSFISIFQSEIWLATLAAFILVVIVYRVGIYWDPRPITGSWSDCTLTVFGLLTAMTSHSRVTDGNVRPNLTAWSAFSLLLTTSLSTGIVFRLTVPLFEDRVDTVRQLVEGQYYWTVQYYARLNSSDFKNSFFDFEDKWHVLFEKRYRYMDAQEVRYRATTDNKLTFMIETYGDDLPVIYVEGLLGLEALQEFRMTESSVASKYVTFGVKKKSFLLEPVTTTTLRCLQAGLLSHWKDDVILRWPDYDTRHLLIEQDVPNFREPRPIRLTKVRAVFYLLLVGLAIASSVFFLEYYHFIVYERNNLGKENVK